MTTRHPCLDAAVRWLPAIVAVAALASGCLVYAIDRPPASAWLLLAGWGRAAGAGRAFGSVGGWLPSFVHGLAFSLLTAACLPATRVARRSACLGWWAVDSAFEIGQHRHWSSAIAAALPDGWQHVPVLDHVGGYLLRGTFDPADLWAIAGGCFAAYALGAALSRGRGAPTVPSNPGACA